MSNTDDIRWQQRFENFGKALEKFSAACQQDTYTELEQAGLVQIFEFTFELAWKTLKDLLFSEGFDEKSPRAVIRRSFEMEYINEDDCEVFLDALKKWNLLSHTYEEEVAEKAVFLIKERYCPVLVRVHAVLEGRQTR